MKTDVFLNILLLLVCIAIMSLAAFAVNDIMEADFQRIIASVFVVDLFLIAGLAIVDFIYNSKR